MASRVVRIVLVISLGGGQNPHAYRTEISRKRCVHSGTTPIGHKKRTEYSGASQYIFSDCCNIAVMPALSIVSHNFLSSAKDSSGLLCRSNLVESPRFVLCNRTKIAPLGIDESIPVAFDPPPHVLPVPVQLVA